MPEIESAAGARAAVLARLWGALAREPIAGIRGRDQHGGTLTVTLGDGRRLHGDAAAAAAFAVVPDTFTVGLDDTAYADPGALIRAWNPPRGQRLAAELDNSVANLALARAHQPPADGGPPALLRAAAEPDPLAYLEQCVVDGHPLHPCCRTRIGLSADGGAGLRAGAPAHRPPGPGRRAGRRGGRAPQRRRRCWCTRGSASTCSTPTRGCAPGRELAARPLMSLRTLSLSTDRPRT